MSSEHGMVLVMIGFEDAVSAFNAGNSGYSQINQHVGK
jgi:hypothetical protein